MKDTLDHSLFYKLGSFSINTYYNFDWAGDPDDKRSMCGYGVYVGYNVISWSSTKAEYHCLALVIAELYWLRMLLGELKISLEFALVVWCDNISTLALDSNLIFHARSKHIEVDYHIVREKVANRDIILQHAPASLQHVDVFTKGHIVDRFVFFCCRTLSVLDRPANL